MISRKLSFVMLGVLGVIGVLVVFGCDRSSPPTSSSPAGPSGTQVASSGVSGQVAAPAGSEREIEDKVGRVHSDMRSMATAIESYFVDSNAYPMWTDQAGETQRPRGGEGKAIPSFQAKTAKYSVMTLTTPIAYITALPADPFSGQPPSAFVYYAPGSGWILISPGPDGRYDLDCKLYDPAMRQEQVSQVLAPFTYDPTNGLTSGGDIWRIKQ